MPLDNLANDTTYEGLHATLEWIADETMSAARSPWKVEGVLMILFAI